jgi:hypothetical protein
MSVVTAAAARQLHLFHGKRQRGRIAPAPSEFQSQAFLLDVIRRWLSPRLRCTHITSGEYSDPVKANRCRRLGVVAGWPDFQFAGPSRQMVFLELKRRGSGRLSSSQEAMRDRLERCSFPFLVTSSTTEESTG